MSSLAVYGKQQLEKLVCGSGEPSMIRHKYAAAVIMNHLSWRLLHSTSGLAEAIAPDIISADNDHCDQEVLC